MRRKLFVLNDNGEDFEIDTIEDIVKRYVSRMYKGTDVPAFVKIMKKKEILNDPLQIKQVQKEDVLYKYKKGKISLTDIKYEYFIDPKFVKRVEKITDDYIQKTCRTMNIMQVQEHLNHLWDAIEWKKRLAIGPSAYSDLKDMESDLFRDSLNELLEYSSTVEIPDIFNYD